MKKSLKIPLDVPVQAPEVNYKLKVFLNLLYYSSKYTIIQFHLRSSIFLIITTNHSRLTCFSTKLK